MINLNFPDANDSTITTTLDGKTYTLRLLWSDAGLWTLSIADETGAVVLPGVPLVANTAVNANLQSYGGPPGLIAAMSDREGALTRDSFRNKYAAIQYVELADLADSRQAANMGAEAATVVLIPVPYGAGGNGTTPTPTPSPAPAPAPSTPPAGPPPAVPVDPNYAENGVEGPGSIAFLTSSASISDANRKIGNVLSIARGTAADIGRTAGLLSVSDATGVADKGFYLPPSTFGWQMANKESVAILVEFVPGSNKDNGMIFSTGTYPEPGFTVRQHSDGSVEVGVKAGQSGNVLNYGGAVSSAGLLKFGQKNRIAFLIDGATGRASTWVNGTKMSDSIVSPTAGNSNTVSGNGLSFGGSWNQAANGFGGAWNIGFSAIHVAVIKAGQTFRSDLDAVFGARPSAAIASYGTNLSSPGAGTPTAPSQSGSSESTAYDWINTVIGDISRTNDVIPLGQTGRKAQSAMIMCGRRNNGDSYPEWWEDVWTWQWSGWWDQIQPWFQASRSSNGITDNLRLAVRNYQVWVQSQKSGQWFQVCLLKNGMSWCELYTPSFTSSQGTNVRVNSNGDSEILLPGVGNNHSTVHGGVGGFNLNTWIEDGDLGNYVIAMEAKLVLDNAYGANNIAKADVGLGVGPDFYPKMGDNRRTFASGDVPASAIARYKRVTDQWQPFTCSPLDCIPGEWVESIQGSRSLLLASTSAFRANPPPFMR